MGSLIKLLITTILTVLTTGSIASTTGVFNTATSVEQRVLSASTSEDILNDIESYHYSNLNGTLVVSAIKKFQHEYPITVFTETGLGTYPKADYNVANLYGSADYIDPNKNFISIVYRDLNGEPVKLEFMEESLFNSTSITEEDLTLAKELIVNAMDTGVSVNMTWNDLLNSVSGRFNELNTGIVTKEALILELLDKINNFEILANEQSVTNINTITEQSILDGIVEVAGVQNGVIVSWALLDELYSKYEKDISDLNAEKQRLQTLVNDLSKYEGMVDIVNSRIEESIKRLEEIHKEIERLSVLLGNLVGTELNGKTLSEVSLDTLNKLNQSVIDITSQINTAKAELSSLNSELATTQEALRLMTIDRDAWKKKYDDELAKTNQLIKDTNTNNTEAQKYLDQYNTTVTELNKVLAQNKEFKDDRTAALVHLKNWLGTYYVNDGTLLSNATALKDRYNTFSKGFTGAYNAVYASKAVYQTSLTPIVTAIVSKNGWVLDAKTQAGIIAGINTIPVALPSIVHSHVDACYPGSRHSHVASCSKTVAGYWYSCGSYCEVYSYSCSTQDCATRKVWVSCTSCNGSGINKNGNVCGCMDGDPYGWWEKEPYCSGHTGNSYCSGNHWSAESSTLTCTLSTSAIYYNGVQSTVQCQNVVTSIGLASNPSVNTTLNGTINTQGMSIVATYMNGVRKTIGGFTVTGVTTSKGAKTGTATINVQTTVTGTKANKTLSFSYTVG